MFEAFLRGSIFDKAVFCLGAKQGTLVNNKCSFCYDRYSRHFRCQFGIEQKQFCMAVPTSLQSAGLMALSVKTVEHE